MTALTWGEPGSHVFETGLEKGVLYPSGESGVAWNGLISVDENTSATSTPVYYDGKKINDIVTISSFSGTLRAYTYPDEFAELEGLLEYQSGVFVAGQIPRRFGLSYVTKRGNDAAGNDVSQKIHLLYNLTAIPSTKRYSTLSLQTEPIEFEWELSSIPDELEGATPSAHLILDSRSIDPWLMADLKDILYGTDTTPPRLPSLRSITTFIKKWDRLIIVDNGDGTWTAESPREGLIVMTDETTFEIPDANAVYLDADTYTISSTDKNEEDVWSQ